jgi:peroxiredoxin
VIDIPPTNEIIRRTGVKFPLVEFKLLNGGTWSSFNQLTESYALLTVYRGMWCNHCKKQLSELNQLTSDFAKRGVELVTVSMDTIERASSTQSELVLDKLNIGYGLPLEQARTLGLFLSSQQKEIEMPVFSEPGTFLIKQDQTLCAAWIASNAFARIKPADVLDYIDFLQQTSNTLPRGSY